MRLHLFIELIKFNPAVAVPVKSADEQRDIISF